MGILQVWDEFFEDVPKDTAPDIGQLYWAPVPDTDEVPKILDVQRVTPEEHHATVFEIAEIANEHFTPRGRLPVKRLNLGETEELVLAKAKKRPVVILAKSALADVGNLPQGSQQRIAKPLGRPSYLVAPLYSVATPHHPTAFGSVLVARIRAMQYPHLFCLPDENKPGTPGSIVRLDRIFATYLGRGTASYGKSLRDEPLEVLLSQVATLFGGKYTEAYDTARELAQEALPEELHDPN